MLRRWRLGPRVQRKLIPAPNSPHQTVTNDEGFCCAESKEAPATEVTGALLKDPFSHFSRASER